jgi:hypothetical protein
MTAVEAQPLNVLNGHSFTAPNRAATTTAAVASRILICGLNFIVNDDIRGQGASTKQNSRGVYAFPVDAVQDPLPSATVIVGDLCRSMDGEYPHPNSTEKLI